MNKKRFIVSFVLLLCISSYFLGYKAMAESAKPKPSWQMSEGVSVQLGVRDKYGNLGEYKATFLVKDEKGGEYKTTKIVKNDEFSFVYFPEDFKVNAKPGLYHWRCIVNGEEIAKGRFLYETVGSYADRAKVFVEDYFPKDGK